MLTRSILRSPALVNTTRQFTTTRIMSEEKHDILKWAADKDGQFKRQASSFRDDIKEGSKFEPEKDRYHLYVSLACPWAHRTLIVRKLKGLDKFIETSTVHPYLLSKGWHFSKDSQPAATEQITADQYEKFGDESFPASTPDHVYGVGHLRDLYFKAEPNYEARYTVPVVWDKKNETIVSNESSEIIRNMNYAFNKFLEPGSKEHDLDLYPESLRKEIDDLNEWVYNDINGVYKSGFATTQAAYESNVVPLFKSLDRVEKMLKGKDFLVGDQLTEADVRLYTTIIRFDPVYVGHFKCNLGTIRHDYPEINRWLKNLYWNYPAFKSTTDFAHIKSHYYHSHKQINNTGIIPMGPKLDIEPL